MWIGGALAAHKEEDKAQPRNVKNPVRGRMCPPKSRGISTRTILQVFRPHKGASFSGAFFEAKILR